MKILSIAIAFFIGTSMVLAQEVAEDRSLLDKMTATLASDNLSLAQDAEEIRALVKEYIDVFNARASGDIA